jgi:hypothetical protein
LPMSPNEAIQSRGTDSQLWPMAGSISKELYKRELLNG